MPDAWLPDDLAEAYRLQAAVAGELGAVAGWKVSAITADQQRAAGLTAPIAGTLLDAWLIDAPGSDAASGPVRLRLTDFIAPQIECEFAFQFAERLPAPAAAAYTRDEVAAAIASMRIGVEIVDPRLRRGKGMFIDLADSLNSGAFVAGPAADDWASIDFARSAISLGFVGADAGSASIELARGSGKAILGGDPFAAVVMLADTLHRQGSRLKAGDIVTTGSCTGAPRLPGPGLCTADFGSLGSIEIRCEQ